MRLKPGTMVRKLDPNEAEAKFHKGLDQFNAGRFFDAHETWEEIWLASPEPEKTFLQGIIQVAAAFHHWTRGNRTGTRSLLKAGVKKLERFPAGHRGLHIGELCAASRRWIAALGAGDDPVREEPPRIRHTRH